MTDGAKTTALGTKHDRGAAAGSRQRTRAGSNAVISVFGAAAVLVMINYLGMRHYVRGDWTSSGLYTLSDKTLKVLSSLDKEVSLYVLWSQADQRFPDVKEILDRYAASSSKVKLEVIDPDMSPDRVQTIVDRYGAKIRDMGGGVLAIEAAVIAVSGENVKFASSADFEDLSGAELDGSGEGQEEKVSEFKAEQAITSAIMSVTSGRQVKVCFTQGHGEWLFEAYGVRGLGQVKDGLVQDGYKVEAVGTTGASHIPAGCDMVVVAGPEKAFMEEEAGLLERYLKQGGRLLLLLDPIIDQTSFAPTGLERLASENGIVLTNDVILESDPKRLVSTSPLTFLASEFTQHGAVKQLSIPGDVGAKVKEQLGASPALFSTVRSLSQRDAEGVAADVLARSSASSWGEVDLNWLGAGESPPAKDQYDTQGPAAFAMAVSLPDSGKDGKGGRLAVVGDCDFLTDEWLRNDGLYNRDFWSGLVGWLSARGDLVSIAPKNPEHVKLTLTESDVVKVWELVIGEVLFFVLLGGIVWMKRRR